MNSQLGAFARFDNALVEVEVRRDYSGEFMQIVRFGIIGLGNMGSFHCASFDQIQDAQLTALCDIDEQRLETIGAKYTAAKFKDYRELIASEMVDAILVA